MCGRYTLAAPDMARIRARFGIEESLEIRRRYNVAPGDDVLAVVNGRDGRHATLLRWGLVPHWAATPSALAVKTINARAETVAQRPAYRDAFARRRCLIVADGFFEWAGGTPHWITRADGAPFAFAGLWASWRPHDDVEPLRSCAIVTTAATESLRALHDRMPVMLQAADEAAWIDPETPSQHLHELLRGFEDTAHRPVSRAVNDARHDAPDCLGPPEQGSLFG
jgi:putative SOS response-associated peptidase YedK